MRLVVGNWKLNGDKNTVIHLIKFFIREFANLSNCVVAVAPPIVYLDVIRHYLMHSDIKLCAQNVDINLFGPYTGDISAKMLIDLNVQYVLIGHSERRIHHKETIFNIAKKFAILKKTGLIPILCVGENREERDAGLTHAICIKQIDAIIELLGIQAFKGSVIAYEPVWAIGTGISADLEEIQKTHKFIRNYIAQYDASIAMQLLIQYGGSVTADNIVSFVDCEDIDGVLIGSASLSIDNFVKIVNVIEER